MLLFLLPITTSFQLFASILHTVLWHNFTISICSDQIPPCALYFSYLNFVSRKKTISRRLCISYIFCKMNILLLYERIIFVRPHCWILKAVSGHFCLKLWLSIISIQLTYILLELSKKLIIALCPLDEQDR